jgi:hypothetical protein
LVFGPLSDIISLQYILIGSGVLLVAASPLVLGCKLSKE